MADDLDLDAIDRLCAAATAGEWFWWMSEEPPFAIDVSGQSVHPYVAHVERIADAEFIAASRTLLPALVAEVRRLRAGREVADDLARVWALHQDWARAHPDADTMRRAVAFGPVARAIERVTAARRGEGEG